METTKPKAAKKAAGTKKVVAKKAVKPAKAAAKSAVKAAAIPSGKKAKKDHKVKVVRDSFTMPQIEYQKIAEIKAASLKAGLPVKKSEVLRAGLQALAALTPAQMQRALAGLEKIKTGRPKASK